MVTSVCFTAYYTAPVHLSRSSGLVCHRMAFESQRYQHLHPKAQLIARPHVSHTVISATTSPVHDSTPELIGSLVWIDLGQLLGLQFVLRTHTM
jgi:hypothetical protein